MSDLPISLQVLTWNSGKTLRRCLESAKVCKEIVIIDGGSTDDTLTIAKEFNATVIPQPQKGPLTDFSAARNAGLKQATQPWIVALDSDEYLEPGFLEEAAALIATGTAACRVPRRYVDAGTVIRHASTYPNERIYFFHKDAVQGWIKPVHERVELKAGIPVHRMRHGTLAPLGTVEEFWQKNEKYLALELERSPKGWGPWFKRVARALRSQAVSTIRLIGIWAIPRGGKKLPMSQELARWKYRWTLVVRTLPGRIRR